jgi:small conductance mechanosensitive channel
VDSIETNATEIRNMLDQLVAQSLEYAPKVVLAIILLIFGLWGVRILDSFITRALKKRRIDESLKPFLRSLISITLKITLFIAVVGMLGVQTTSFVTLLGAAGLAIGLSLQGSLSNFAGGVLILLFKPFKVGDFIETQNLAGTVKEIQILYTILTTPSNQQVILPNGSVANGNITNFSSEPTRRLDLTFGVGYKDELSKVRRILEAVVEKDSRILPDPAPFIAVSALGDNSVSFLVRVWVDAADYWPLHFDMMEKVKTAFDEADINIPFPQSDVHLYVKEDLRPVKDKKAV